MPPIISAVVSHVPTWVWAILAFILVMGVRQSRDQLIARARLLILPLAWAAFGAWGVAQSFGLHLLPLLAWAAGLALGLRLVTRSGWPGRARFDAGSQRFFVPGSWLPMALMLGIFSAKFALGFSLALRPALAQAPLAALGFALLFGALGGVLLGRSRNILACAPVAGTLARA